MHRITWAIWYSDGSSFTNLDGEPRDAPRLGVQVIIEEKPNNEYFICHGDDYFYYEEKAGGFSGSGYLGWIDHLIRERNPCPFFGRMISNEDFGILFTKAKEHWFKHHPGISK